MINLWFNIRFGVRHWKWGPDGMTWEVNPMHVGWRNEMPETWKWFAVYCAFGQEF